MNIYLAGSIGPGDYRHRLIPELRNWDSILIGDDIQATIVETGLIPQWPIWRNAIFGKHNYTGPYFVSCDHGCWHGNNQHGTIGGGCAGDIDVPHGAPSIRSQVLDRCKSAIKASDIIFGWIDSTTCYGTIAEIGYAHALGKKIYIAGQTRFNDLWFVYAMANHDATMDSAFGWEDDEFIGFTPDDYKDHAQPFISEYLKWCIGGIVHRDYINSDIWKRRARIAKEQAGWRCQVCNKHKSQTILDAHHRTYERLGWEDLSDITVLCRECHELYESGKRTQKQVTTQPSRRSGKRKR